MFDTAADAKAVPPQDRVADPALLIIDMQNDFVRAGAPLEVPQSRGTIAIIADLSRHFRKRGLPVIYTRFLSRTSANLLWLWSPQCNPETRCCWPGHAREYNDGKGPRACADIIDDLAPHPGEIVIDKYGYGAFHGTALDETLHRMGVKSVLVTGTVTQICVEETAREAFHHGYLTTIVSDAVSSPVPDLHDATLKNFAAKFGWVTDSKTLVSCL